ncbi:TPR domain-containing protein [Naegleria gruberi]|uniref:TPR domain-containing protein n=1 Tax=Naegleria gruberi TaxID=5762 RepID=D2VSS7_NAEGR|nr:TPR domain-containing protein [Naegleria gruberi]EFC40248.1 TPR domain-containing protein [Naegleria gruberi]|eukprot:XP_002672992.1 TPR domain-containing protein [Naegleria gruberi strain NEG-M]
MCGSVPIPTGPFAILFFPILMAASSLDRMHYKAIDMKRRIRQHNKNLDEGIRTKRKQFKEELKERILYRKQYKAEKSLMGKMKISEGMVQEKEDQSNQSIISTEDAILYLQRSVVRISSNKFEKALQDIKLAIYLDYTLKETYVVQYFEGFILYMLGDYLESAHAFKSAIEFKEDQDEKSILLEKKIFEIQHEMKHRSEKVIENLTEIHEQTKTYFKSAHKKLLGKLGMNSHQQEENIEPTSNQQHSSMISLEELYYRAGISYYFSTYYHDSIKYYSKAIEMGESNSNIYHYIFNRGLSYFYSHEVDLALQDFLHAQTLNETDEVYKMLAYAYGRKGMEKEKSENLKKAQRMNPNTNIVSCFIYRLLDDNCTELIFSFLPVHNRVLLSRTGKYWREIAMRSIANEEVFKISLYSIFNNVDMHLKKVNTTTLKGKLFMPTQYRVHVMDLVEKALGASAYQYFLEKPAKKIDCYMATPAGSIYEYMTFNSNGLSFFKQVDCLNIAQNALRDEVIQVLTSESPNLKELTIRTGSYVYNDISILRSIANFTNLKKLAWHFDFSTDQSSSNILTELVLPPSLEVFEYATECTSLIEQFVAPSYPNVHFVPIENTMEIAKQYCEVFEDCELQ